MIFKVYRHKNTQIYVKGLVLRDKSNKLKPKKHIFITV